MDRKDRKFDLLGDPADRLRGEEYTEEVRLLVENLQKPVIEAARSKSVRQPGDPGLGEPDLQQWAKARAQTGLMHLARAYPEITESRRMLDFWPAAAMREAINNNDRKAFLRALRRYMVIAKHEAVRIPRRRSGQRTGPGSRGRARARRRMRRQTEGA